MTISPAVLRAMQAAGASTDIIIAAIEADAAQDAARVEAKRVNNAERQRRFKAKNRKPVTVGNADNALPGVTSSPEVSPNDIYSNPLPNPTSDAEASRQPFAEKVVEAWNEGPAKRGATGAKPLDAGRRKALSQRVREHTEAEVFEAIRNIGASDFHCGRNDRGWTANIGWLLKSAENFQKALELQPRPAPPSQSANAPTDLVQHILKRRAA